jgi:exopolysaccharide biosynthesis polyprenyl glycosylphosphotransferase
MTVSRGLLSLTWLTSFLVVGAARFWYRRLIYRLRQDGHFLRPTLVVGADAEGVALASQLAHSGASGLAVLGFVDSRHPVGSRIKDRWPVLGSLDDLETLIEREGVAQLVVATGGVPRARLLEIVSTYGPARHVDIHFSSGLFDVLTTGVQVQERAYVPLISLNKTRLTPVDLFLKTGLDLTVTIPGLLVLLPVFLIVAVAIKLDSPGPVIYRRRVLGLNGKEFDAYKFRTMRTDWERSEQDEQVQQQFVVGQKPKEDPRVTHIGRALRRYSLDELPQLVNVLKREMSLVGPRMITRQEAGFYQQWLMNLLTIRPGITGLWQVSGRAETSYEDKVRLDMTYIRNYTIWLDLQLLFQTIPVTLRSRGAY